jgi:hypothetical protein
LPLKYLGFFILLLYIKELKPWYLSRYSAGLRAGRLGFDSRRGREFLSSPPRPERLWGPPSLLSNGYQGIFLWG